MFVKILSIMFDCTNHIVYANEDFARLNYTFLLSFEIMNAPSYRNSVEMCYTNFTLI